MTCEAWGEDLSAWMDGELPEQRASQVARHLKGCADCQRALRGFQQLTSIARKQSAPRVSSRVTDPAMKLVNERARSRRGVPRWRMLLDAFLPKMTLAVAGAAVAGLLAVIATHEFGQSPYHQGQTTVASTAGETSPGERSSAQPAKPGISGDLSVADAKDGADRVAALGGRRVHDGGYGTAGATRCFSREVVRIGDMAAHDGRPACRRYNDGRGAHHSEPLR
jgi:hypothetical protein